MVARTISEACGIAEVSGGLRSIVIYDDFKNPILVVQKLQDGRIYVASPKDLDFPKILSALGIGLSTTTYKVGAREFNA